MSADAPVAPQQPRLTFDDISKLHDRQDQILKSNEQYVGEHPELKDLIADFTAAILMQKPDDVFKFARDHFSVYLKGSAPKDSQAVYYGQHVISGKQYELVIIQSTDRAKWLQATATSGVEGESPVTQAFSTSEVMARFAMTVADAEKAALQLSRCLLKHDNGLIMSDTTHASPTVEEYNATVTIQAVGRSRLQRLKESYY